MCGLMISPLAVAMKRLCELQEMERKAEVVAPDRLPTIQAATHYFIRIVALLTRVSANRLSAWDSTLIEFWIERARDLLDSIGPDDGGVN